MESLVPCVERAVAKDRHMTLPKYKKCGDAVSPFIQEGEEDKVRT